MVFVLQILQKLAQRSQQGTPDAVRTRSARTGRGLTRGLVTSDIIPMWAKARIQLSTLGGKHAVGAKELNGTPELD